ncbi:universal stress protein [Ascidiimonas aurantiaca]|uniref:universal stress protein n=1 Tax=Ascidiimonas aurantiaca TaxID=1685432 RepID=UPI0030ED004D
MKTILYATDCTDYSVAALQYAYFLCKKLEASMVVLYVYDIPITGVSGLRPVGLDDDKSFESYQESLTKYCRKHLGNELGKMNIRCMTTRHASVSGGILSVAGEIHADLMMIGMKDEHTTRGLFAGDIAKILIDKAHIPVLAIPNNIERNEISQIAYATAFEESDIRAIQQLTGIARPFEASIHVVHISTREEYSGKDQMEWFKEMLGQQVDYPHITFRILFSDAIYETLSDYITDTKANMLGMLERKNKGFMKKLFQRDLVKKMEASVHIPLVSFPKEKH